MWFLTNRRPDRVLWLLALPLLCVWLSLPRVTRTQEARVLETAREMLGAPFQTWMIPQVNGHPRMQKPPLAYWLTAGSFAAFGVGEWQGRLPAVVASWFTLGMTMAITRRLFDTRAAVLTGMALVGSMMFFRHARLAETDILVMCFVTAAIIALWRAAGIDSHDRPSFVRSAKWYHVAGAMMALAVMSKGPGGALPLVFLVALCGVERRWQPLRDFAISGAPLTLLALALPWFAYVAASPTAAALTADLDTSLRGKGWESPLAYVAPLITGTLPWTLLLVVGIVAAAGRWRDDARVRGSLIWSLSVLVPLSLWGNKQKHYLLPLLPPLMILVGWQLNRMSSVSADTSAHKEDRWNDGTWRATLIAYAVAGLAVPVVGFLIDRRVRTFDVAFGLAVLATAFTAMLVWRQRGFASGLTLFAIANLGIISSTLSHWASTLTPRDEQAFVQAVYARFGRDIPLVFVDREQLAMVWHLKRVVPVSTTDEDLANLARIYPGLVGIQVLDEGKAPRSALLAEAIRIETGDDEVYIAGPIFLPTTLPQDR